jgi:hypothetical protein
MRRPFLRWSPILAVVMLAAVGLAANGPADRSPSEPRYTPGGKLVRPEGYRTWVFVGADIGLSYDPKVAENTVREKSRHDDSEVGNFHNIYIDRAAYDHYVATGKFPDKTVLVMEQFRARQKDPGHVVTDGDFEAERVGFEVAVKDRERPGGEQGVPWAYYIFQNDGKPDPPAPSASAQPKNQCYDCHLKHADVDNVWVQFYPTLRDLKHP